MNREEALDWLETHFGAECRDYSSSPYMFSKNLRENTPILPECVVKLVMKFNYENNEYNEADNPYWISGFDTRGGT